jgi:RHS repeat-associated protein
VRDEDVDTGTTTMTYTAANQLASRTTARGVTLTYDYDKLGRQLDTKIGAAVQTQVSYDTASFGKGEIASTTRYVNGNAYTATTAGYSAMYQPIAVTVTVPDSEGALAGSYTQQMSYNVDGSAKGITYAAAGDLPAEPMSYNYDDLGDLLTTSGGFDGNTYNYVTDTQYTRYGEVQRVQLGDTGKRTWLSTYYDDSTRRVQRTIIDAEVPSPMQSDTHYTYDDYGNITSIADTPQGKPADVQCFKQDYLQRLTEAWTPSGSCADAPSAAHLAGPAPYWQSYSYDKVGNRLTQTQHAAAGDIVTTSTYPATGHKVSSTSTTGPGGTTSSQFQYDASGNTVSRKLPGATQQLDWDPEGHLAKVTEGSKVTDFVYDAEGTRLVRHDSTGATLYLAGEELHVDKGSNAGKATRYYQYGGRAIGMRDATGLTWLAPDFQGTSQVAINGDTLKVTQRRQTPYGEPRGPTVTFPGTKGFLGGTTDSSIGLTQLGAREYDSALGRFLSTDPVVQPDNPQQLNPYGYANANPVNQTDASGLQAGSWCATAACADAGANSPGLSGYGIYPTGSPQHVDPGPVYQPVSTHVAADSRVAQHLRELYAAEIGKIAPALKPGEAIPSDVEGAAWKDLCSGQTQLCDSGKGMDVVFMLGMLEPTDATRVFLSACAVDNTCNGQRAAIFADEDEVLSVGGASQEAPETVKVEIPPEIRGQMERARNVKLLERLGDESLSDRDQHRAVGAAYDPVTGDWVVSCSGYGRCAEPNGDADLVRQTGDPESAERSLHIPVIREEEGEIVTKHVCPKCQNMYSPSRFDRGVLGAPKGSWAEEFKAATKNGPGPQMRYGGGGPFAQEPPE